MYERMLDKQNMPVWEGMCAHCGENAGLFQELNDYLTETFGTVTTVRFPYGKQYGWGVKHAVKSRHICDIFPEAGAFTVMMRMSNQQFAAVYDGLLDCTRDIIDHKYPCGEGGWIHYRVLCREQLEDAKKLLQQKISSK